MEYWNTDRSILPSFQCSSIPIFPGIGPKSNIQPCRFTLETVEWKVCKKIKDINLAQRRKACPESKVEGFAKEENTK
jgi:hypothetical protein